MLLFEVLDAVGKLSPEQMPASHRFVMVTLANYGEQAFPSLADLAQRTGYGRSTIARYIAELEAAGWVEIIRRRVGREQTSNLYRVRTSGRPLSESPALRLSRRDSHGESLTERVSSGDGGSPGAGTPSPGAGHELPNELPTELSTPRSTGAREEPAEVPGGLRVIDHEGHPVEVAWMREPGNDSAAPAAPHTPADLVALLADLTAEGHAYGSGVAAQLAQGRPLTHGQRVKLRQIHAEREAREREAAAPAAPRAGGPEATPDERALVEAYVAAVKRQLKREIPALERDLRAAPRVLADARKAAELAAAKSSGWTPSPLDVAKHWITLYLAVADRKLADQGYPLALLLSRIDPADLPRPPRARRPAPAAAPEPPIDPAAHCAAARAALEHATRLATGTAKLEGYVAAFGPGTHRASPPLPDAAEAEEIAAAVADFNALRASAGGAL